MQSRRQVSVPALQGWRNTQLKSRKRALKTERSDDKGAVAVVKNCTSIGLCLTRFRGIRTSEKNDVSGKTESKSFAINSTDTIDTVYATSCKYPRKKKKDHRLEKYRSKYFISEVPTLWNLRTYLKKRLKDKSDAPAARHGILPEIFTNSKKRTKLHSIRLPKSWSCRPQPP